ncbi:MAG: RNA polymerase sigma factor [Rudaea sp.]
MSPSPFDLELPKTLLDRACAGDMAAFEQIYRRFERPVFSLAWRVLGNRESAQDVLHDAMLKVFQRIGQYRSDAPFWAWLRQIALNEALMRLRGSRHEWVDVDTHTLVDDTPEPSVRADAATLERALDRLPATTRSVLWLYHVEGYSHPEIAAAMGKTTSFSKSQLARGTARMRVLLDPATESVSCLIQTPQPG